MIKQALFNNYNKPKDKPREIGKYHASELWYIYKGYTTTGNFFKQKPADKQGIANMFIGSAMEDRLVKVLLEENEGYETQTRHEMEIDKGIVISGKTDLEDKDKVIELKCPKEDTYGVPDKWKFQMEFYHRATGKDVRLGIFYKNDSELIRFFPYEPSNETWELIQNTIKEFHLKLQKKYGK